MRVIGRTAHISVTIVNFYASPVQPLRNCEPAESESHEMRASHVCPSAPPDGACIPGLVDPDLPAWFEALSCSATGRGAAWLAR